MVISKIALLVGIVLVLLVYAAGRFFGKPDIGLVNGFYENPCCNVFRLSDGQLTYGNSHLPYKLTWMKFGLTAYFSGSVTRDVIEPSSSEVALVFIGRDGKQGFRTLVDNQEYLFSRRP